MGPNSSSRCSALSCLESCTPRMNFSGAKITAAATTGPAMGPTPASSTPATTSTPVFQSLRSYRRLGRLLIASAPRSCEPLEPRLPNHLGSGLGIADVVEMNGVVGARRRRDCDVAEPDNSLQEALIHFDRADIGEFH